MLMGSEVSELVHRNAPKLPSCLPRVWWPRCDTLFSVIWLFLNKIMEKKNPLFWSFMVSNFDKQSPSLHAIPSSHVPLTWKWIKSFTVVALYETFSEPEYTYGSHCYGVWRPQTPLPRALTAAACLDIGLRSVVYFGAVCNLKWPTTMCDLLVSSSFFVQQLGSSGSRLLSLAKQRGGGTGFSTEISHSPTAAGAVIIPLLTRAASALFSVSVTATELY